MSAIQLAVAAAPKVEALYVKGKEFISALFGAGLLTIEQQDALHKHVDALQALALAGIVPDAWKVEPDPVPLVNPLTPPTPA